MRLTPLTTTPRRSGTVHVACICTGAEETVDPGGVEVLGFDDSDRDARVGCVERYAVADHLVLQVLAHRQVRQHRDLGTALR